MSVLVQCTLLPAKLTGGSGQERESHILKPTWVEREIVRSLAYISSKLPFLQEIKEKNFVNTLKTFRYFEQTRKWNFIFFDSQLFSLRNSISEELGAPL